MQQNDPLPINLDRERLGLVADSVVSTTTLFQTLQDQVKNRSDHHVLVASWRKRTGEQKACPVPSAKTLNFVLQAYFRCKCTELQFWVERRGEAPAINAGSMLELYFDLFLP